MYVYIYIYIYIHGSSVEHSANVHMVMKCIQLCNYLMSNMR